jgi:lytic murein transglycosylase
MARFRNTAAALGVLLAGVVGAAASVQAATCRDPAGFEKWLGDIRREALAQGISARAVEAGLAGVSYDQGTMRRDHGQGVFRQSFEQFSGRMISPSRVNGGQARLRQYAGVLSRIESQYGVPGPVLMAIWGLETDFGAVRGQGFSIMRSVATLAFDCRRTERFTGELFAGLKIIDRGDLGASELRGGWAGEIGQTQFMLSSYLRYAVDGDGDGRRDLVRSPADVLASTANYLRGHGWQRGAGWEPGQPNFAVIREWNKSEVYARTVAALATRIAGGGRSAGRGSE